jgi:hypothetical protein
VLSLIPGDSELTAFPACSQACLDGLKLKVQGVDPKALQSMFPKGPDGAANLNAVISFIKNGSSSIANSIKAGFGAYFEADATGSLQKLKSTINGINCKTNESGCYGESLLLLRCTIFLCILLV